MLEPDGTVFVRSVELPRVVEQPVLDGPPLGEALRDHGPHEAADVAALGKADPGPVRQRRRAGLRHVRDEYVRVDGEDLLDLGGFRVAAAPRGENAEARNEKPGRGDAAGRKRGGAKRKAGSRRRRGKGCSEARNEKTSRRRVAATPRRGVADLSEFLDAAPETMLTSPRSKRPRSAAKSDASYLSAPAAAASSTKRRTLCLTASLAFSNFIMKVT